MATENHVEQAEVNGKSASQGDVLFNCSNHDYPNSAATFFGEHFAHRLRWGHAVNSKRALKASLRSSVHFLEADVAAGPLLPPEVATSTSRASSHKANSAPTTTVKTAAGDPIIMAHYPTERSSDLSFEDFIRSVMSHNAKVETAQLRIPPCKQRSAATTDTPGEVLDTGASPLDSVDDDDDFAADAQFPASLRGTPQQQPQSRESFLDVDAHRLELEASSHHEADEAAAFAQVLDKELDTHAKDASVITSCVGSRRDRQESRFLTKKGVKLDFKQFDCVEPAIRFLADVGAAKQLGGHLWLNADVLAGPGNLLTPFDAKQFVRLCAESMPQAVLSLSWGSSVLSTTRLYTSDMVERMIELCMTPLVPHELPSLKPREEAVPQEMYLTPVASCRHITFGVAAEYALSSTNYLRKVLDTVPGTSLTIFSGLGSMGITPETVEELIREYGKTRLFLDLRVTKPWRNCTQAVLCVAQ
eukprot:TRINITY_DN61149_c0_g1_i1.p1 TRINITY_DN61149_c0_g1~~TRINITY_DN61149_c0_g1_i1.p1  ORF type:complete len:474 (+),score=93.15 TRINITY_DN61149_c0_g1_i1:143-1564(+)